MHLVHKQLQPLFSLHTAHWWVQLVVISYFHTQDRRGIHTPWAVLQAVC
jgi:hypothetical protein